MLTCFFCSFFETKYCVFILHQFSNNFRCHWVVCVSALMGKENGKLEGRGKVFLPSNSPECLEWLYSLHQIAVSIYEIFFCLNQFIFEERLLFFFFFFLSFWEWAFWDDGPYCPWSSGLTGGTRLEDHGQCAGLYGFFFFVFFYLLINLLCCHLVWD